MYNFSKRRNTQINKYSLVWRGRFMFLLYCVNEKKALDLLDLQDWSKYEQTLVLKKLGCK